MTRPASSGTDTREHDLNLLAAYIDGRLDRDERNTVTAHLAGCAACRDTLAEFARGARASAPWLASLTRSAWLPLAASLVIATVVGVNLVRRTSPKSVSPAPLPEAATLPAETRPSPEDAKPREKAPAEVAPSSAAQGGIDERLLVKRGGATRSVAGKSFHLVAGEWVDRAFDRAAALQVVEAKGPAEKQALLERLPALRPYAALGDRVTVAFEGTVYRFSP